MKDSVRKDMTFPQSREDVWHALTDSAVLAQWLMPNDFEPRAGHRFTFRGEPNPQADWDGMVHCEVLTCDPPSELGYSWAGGGVDTRVTFRLEPDGAGTRLVMEQSGFDTSQPWSAQAIGGAEYGWTRMLEQLAKVLETPAAQR
jgi:uncharacterized protein YndB with AHSA1/START domain